MSGSVINVGICLDARMLNAAFVLLASIKAHARPERPVRVYAITDFSAKNKTSTAAKDLADVAARMTCDRFSLVQVPAGVGPDGLPVRDHITAGTYLRFRLPDLLPAIAKIVYLDVDTVVHHDLAPLFDTDLAGNALAGMPDFSMLLGAKTWPTFFIPYEGRRFRFDAYAETVLALPCPNHIEYFNCGVLVLDLDAWRGKRIADQTMAVLRAHPNLYLMDQDALNLVIAGAFTPLDPRWNAFAKNAGRPVLLDTVWLLTAYGRAWNKVRAAWRRDPWIAHFAGANKPWMPREPRTPQDDLWWRYARLSPAVGRVIADYRALETKARTRHSKIPAAGIDGVARPGQGR